MPEIIILRMELYYFLLKMTYLLLSSRPPSPMPFVYVLFFLSGYGGRITGLCRRGRLGGLGIRPHLGGLTLTPFLFCLLCSWVLLSGDNGKARLKEQEVSHF